MTSKIKNYTSSVPADRSIMNRSDFNRKVWEGSIFRFNKLGLSILPSNWRRDVRKKNFVVLQNEVSVIRLKPTDVPIDDDSKDVSFADHTIARNPHLYFEEV